MLGSLHSDTVSSGLLREESEFVESQSAVDSGLSHPNVVLLRAGEVCKSEREGGGRDDSYLGVDCRITTALLQSLSQLNIDAAPSYGPSEHVCLENEADLRLAVSLDLGDTREGEYRLDDRVMVLRLRPDDDVDVAYGLPAPASTAC